MSWLFSNISWIFSGIGNTVLSGIARWLQPKRGNLIGQIQVRDVIITGAPAASGFEPPSQANSALHGRSLPAYNMRSHIFSKEPPG